MRKKENVGSALDIQKENSEHTLLSSRRVTESP